MEQSRYVDSMKSINSNQNLLVKLPSLTEVAFKKQQQLLLLNKVLPNVAKGEFNDQSNKTQFVGRAWRRNDQDTPPNISDFMKIGSIGLGGYGEVHLAFNMRGRYRKWIRECWYPFVRIENLIVVRETEQIQNTVENSITPSLPPPVSAAVSSSTGTTTTTNTNTNTVVPEIKNSPR